IPGLELLVAEPRDDGGPLNRWNGAGCTGSDRGKGKGDCGEEIHVEISLIRDRFVAVDGSIQCLSMVTED
ncbi:MAG: hypothetical protein M1830_010502, partial [Pleopsidium flavum]